MQYAQYKKILPWDKMSNQNATNTCVANILVKRET